MRIELLADVGALIGHGGAAAGAEVGLRCRISLVLAAMPRGCSFDADACGGEVGTARARLAAERAVARVDDIGGVSVRWSGPGRRGGTGSAWWGCIRGDGVMAVVRGWTGGGWDGSIGYQGALAVPEK
jgi:hypothetical protein